MAGEPNPQSRSRSPFGKTWFIVGLLLFFVVVAVANQIAPGQIGSNLTVIILLGLAVIGGLWTAYAIRRS